MRKVPREEIQNERKESRRFEGEGGVGTAASKRGRWARLNSGGIQLKESEEKDTVLVGVGPPEEAEMVASGVRAV